MKIRNVVARVARSMPTRRGMPLPQCDKLNFGCGYDKRAGYLNVDMDPACRPDLLVKNGDLSRIPRGRFREVLAKDVLEHVPRPRTLALLLDFADFLVPNGRLLLGTTSVLHVAAKLQRATSFADHYKWSVCLFGNQAHAGDYHYIGFTETTLRVHLLAAGFAVHRCEMREGWMFDVEAYKENDWAWDALDAGQPDDEFVRRVYLSAFDTEAPADHIAVHCKNLKNGASRKVFLQNIFSSPDRLLAIAKRHGL